MQKFTTDSMHLAATLFVFGHEPEVAMVSDKKAKFMFTTSEELQELVKRFGLSDEQSLRVIPRDLFTAWSVMRTKVLEAQKTVRK